MKVQLRVYATWTDEINADLVWPQTPYSFPSGRAVSGFVGALGKMLSGGLEFVKLWWTDS